MKRKQLLVYEDQQRRNDASIRRRCWAWANQSQRTIWCWLLLLFFFLLMDSAGSGTGWTRRRWTRRRRRVSCNWRPTTTPTRWPSSTAAKSRATPSSRRCGTCWPAPSSPSSSPRPPSTGQTSHFDFPFFLLDEIFEQIPTTASQSVDFSRKTMSFIAFLYRRWLLVDLVIFFGIDFCSFSFASWAIFLHFFFGITFQCCSIIETSSFAKYRIYFHYHFIFFRISFPPFCFRWIYSWKSDLHLIRNIIFNHFFCNQWPSSLNVWLEIWKPESFFVWNVVAAQLDWTVTTSCFFKKSNLIIKILRRLSNKLRLRLGDTHQEPINKNKRETNKNGAFFRKNTNYCSPPRLRRRFEES